MEVDGKEFMRNVALEQDKERLRREQEKLEALKRESVYRQQQQQRLEDEDQPAYVDLSLGSFENKKASPEPTIEDIMLEPEDPNKQKKKYILLGLALILVFVITILVIRVVSNSDTELATNDVQTNEQKEFTADAILDKIDANEDFQKALETKEVQKEVQAFEQQRATEEPKFQHPDEAMIEKTSPLLIEKQQPQEPPRKDPLGLDSEPIEKTVMAPQKEEVQPAQNVVKTKNVVAEKTVKVETKAPAVSPAKTSSNVSGYYIQVGAFTKQPAKALLDQITKSGYSYTIYPVNVKGTLYNKVIIGPYPTKATATNDLPLVKQKLSKPGAYVLKF